MKLITKITIPVIVLLALTISIITGISFYFEKRLIDENMSSMTESKVEEAEGVLVKQIEEMRVLENELSTTYKEKVGILSLLIAEKPEVIESSDKLTQLLDTLNVEEIHVTDENGIIRWSTVPEFVGFDFNSSDQTKPFLEALTNKDFELVQEPSERGADKVLFQYIGMARQDKPGIVQIGLKPERLQQALEKSDIKAVAKDMILGTGGSVYIVDSNDIIVSAKDRSIIGKKASELGLDERIKAGRSGNIYCNIAGVRNYVSYKSVDKYLAIAAIPEAEFTTGLNTLMLNIAVISIISLIICVLVIFLLLRFNVVREMKKLLSVLRKIGEGNLKEKAEVRSSVEFIEFSNGINQMSDNLNGIITDNIRITEMLSESAEKLAESADQTSRGAEEVATTINELAQGANEQAESATKGATLAKEALAKLEAIADNIREAVTVTNSTRSSVEYGFRSIELQDERMERNTDSTRQVNTAITELAAKANEIGNIVNVITGIADQTNMLALNAAIEAARAGEAGKGFAVVADEVRKLAESSTASARRISVIISEIQNKVEQVKEHSDTSIHAVKDQQEAIEGTKSAFEKIRNESDLVVENIELISESADTILNAVEEIVQVMESTAASSQQSAAGTEEISASTEEQTAAIEEVAQIAGSLAKMVDELRAFSKRFMV